jgi:hypothetical protein
VSGRSCDVQYGLQGPVTFEPFANPHEGVVLGSTVLTAPINTTFVQCCAHCYDGPADAEGCPILD